MDIKFWQTSSGRLPVLSFIEAETPNVKKRLMDSLDHFEQQGLNLLINKKKLEKLTGYKHLYELKIRFQGVAYRIICHVKNGLAYLVHAFKKKTEKTRKQDIELAHERSKSLN